MDLPANFFVYYGAQMYNLIRTLLFFVFDYNLVAGGAQSLSYTNPFTGRIVEVFFPSFGSGLVTGAIVDGIERFFNINISVSFFDILFGPALLIFLAYAFIKYLNPI